MAKIRDNYENSLWGRMARWVNGEYDPFENAYDTAPAPAKTADQSEAYVYPAAPEEIERPAMRRIDRVYRLLAVAFCVVFIGAMLLTVSSLPRFGDATSPDNNEVSARYIEQGVYETGATNIVAGMILDYRAFDTFGESCVLFTAVCCVFILLKVSAGGAHPGENTVNDRLFEPKNDAILQGVAQFLCPLILLFGFYIMVNGHLTAGGGFSGGAVAGAGLILYLLAFGFDKTERLFTEKTFKVITTSALMFYCLAKSYSFYTGANHLESGIPLGTPGAILSSGLILPLNICVGFIVMCTMYAFYAMFRKGDF